MIPSFNPTHHSLWELYLPPRENFSNLSSLAESDIASSRSLFESSSLLTRNPVPRSLEVIALLGGLPFSDHVITYLTSIQQQVAKCLRSTLVYWVKPNNLAVEVCVLKWPSDPYQETYVQIFRSYLNTIDPIQSFNIIIHGFQIHQDGCIVALGYDENNAFTSFRKNILNELEFMPRKQSSWCHIPLGRILEPINENTLQDLKNLVDTTLDSSNLVSQEVKSFSLIHEHRWYMEDRTLLHTFDLSCRST